MSPREGASIAIAATLVVATDARAVPVLLVPALTVFAVYRAYISERQRHERLEFLYEANRTLSLFAVFATGLALVRLTPGRWHALLGGVLIASVALSGYALLTKVFPATLAADETYARLRAPKLPPTSCEITRSCAGAMPSTAASSRFCRTAPPLPAWSV